VTPTLSDPEEEWRRHLGDEVGREVNALEAELVVLNDKWREYVTLFGVSQGRVDLLNEAGGRFFGMVDSVFFEDILLHLCRLTDLQVVKEYELLTIRRLPSFFEDKPFHASLKKAVNRATRATAFATDWRHKRLAHHSRARALDPQAHPLKPASRERVQKALDAIAAVFHVLHDHYWGGRLDFNVVGGVGDAQDVVNYLGMGRRAIRERDARIERREFRPGDFEPPDAV